MGRLLDKIGIEAVVTDIGGFTDGVTYDVTLTMEGRSEHFDWWRHGWNDDTPTAVEVLRDMEWDIDMLEAEGFYTPQELGEVLEEQKRLERLLGGESMEELFREVNEVYVPDYGYDDEY